jgi:hypothetical protein
VVIFLGLGLIIFVGTRIDLNSEMHMRLTRSAKPSAVNKKPGRPQRSEE